MSRVALGCAVLALAACSSQREPAARKEPAPVAAPPRDAGVTAIGGYDPASGMHLDDDGASRADPSRPPRPRSRAGKPVDILLKSTPTGAMAAVDGVQVGVTPTYWSGEDGREHDFTFVMRNHAVAHYRFVPITSGTVHARLEPIAEEVTDGGVAPAPVFTPDAPVAPMAVDAAIPRPDAPGIDPMPPEDPRGGVGPKP